MLMWVPGVVYNGHSCSEYHVTGCTHQQSMSLFHCVINNCITVCISFADVCVEVIIYYVIISERELTFAICCHPSVFRLSVCLSVGNARAPYSGGCNFPQYFNGARYLGHPLTSTENFTEIVPGEPLCRGS